MLVNPLSLSLIELAEVTGAVATVAAVAAPAPRIFEGNRAYRCHRNQSIDFENQDKCRIHYKKIEHKALEEWEAREAQKTLKW